MVAVQEQVLPAITLKAPTPAAELDEALVGEPSSHAVESQEARARLATMVDLLRPEQGSYSDAGNSYNFNMFQFSPTWGGNVGAQKHQTDHYWFDHTHLSTR